MQAIDITVGRSIPLPVLARAVPAGFPSPADDHIEEEIDLQRLLITNRPATFLVRVAGDSMVGKGLQDGDLAVVDRSLDPRDGDIVVVDVDGERSFKVWGRRGRRLRHSRHPERGAGCAAGRPESRHLRRPGVSAGRGR